MEKMLCSVLSCMYLLSSLNAHKNIDYLDSKEETLVTKCSRKDYLFIDSVVEVLRY